jgi:phosphate/sulfate permease
MILSDDSTINLIYVSQIVDPTILSPLLGNAIATYLALDICYSVTQDANLRSQLNNEFQTVIRVAKNQDSKQNMLDPVIMSWLTDLRWAGVGSGGGAYAPQGYPLAPNAGGSS